MMVKRFLSVGDHIIGKSVHDAVNEQIGTIKDVFIDSDANRPLFVVLSTGGFLGIGSEHLVLPWHTLSFNTNSHDIKLTHNRQELENAPDVDIDKLKNADRAEIEKMTGFYGEGDFLQAGSGNESGNSYEQPDEHKHQSYEGSAKITGEAPESNEPSKDMDYEKAKGMK